MTLEPSSFESVRAWAEGLAAMEPLEPALYEPEECESFLRNWIAACRDARRLLEAVGPGAASFVEVTSYSLGEVVWREDVSLQLAEDAVSQSPQMIRAVCELTGPTVVTGSFWIVLVRQWRSTHQRDTGHRLLPIVKSTLLLQLETSGGSQCLLDSAWEGVKMIDEDVGAKARGIDDALKGPLE